MDSSFVEKRGRAIEIVLRIVAQITEERRREVDIPTRREVEVKQNLFEELREREMGA